MKVLLMVEREGRWVFARGQSTSAVESLSKSSAAAQNAVLREFPRWWLVEAESAAAARAVIAHVGKRSTIMGTNIEVAPAGRILAQGGRDV